MQIIYLTKSDILSSNKAIIEVFGGNYVPPFNLLNEGALDYLIEIVEHGVLFGEPMYPDIESKAALYLYNIVQNHIFSDGNKRTGLDAMLTFLQLNKFDLNERLNPIAGTPSINPQADNDSILELFVIEVAEGKIDHEAATLWLQENIGKV